MKVLLMSGLGPYAMNSQTLDHTLLAPERSPALLADYARIAGREVELGALRYGPGAGRQLLRPFRGSMPHLPTETVRHVLETAGVDHEVFELEDLWQGTREAPRDDFDVVGLSTTFLCDRGTLKVCIDWIHRRYPDATLVLGGQYSNLKYAEILEDHPAVDYVVRGDAEEALPILLRVLGGKADLDDVPNLAARGPDGAVRTGRFEYIDLETHPSPGFRGRRELVPYESMRGCPFDCRYCSFPAASPKWRYKSVEKICGDWRGYAEANGTRHVRSMDSTFTIPPKRFRALLDALPDVGVSWEAYTRANVIDSPAIVERLEAAHCTWLLIGFESMSDRTLRFMSKRVSAAQNERAFELLTGSNIDLRTSFIVGYPGETPEDYELTHRFVVDRLTGRYGVHAFVLVDETMPVWEDAEMHQIELEAPYRWQHVGMDSATAYELRDRTLLETRWQNEKAVLSLWQMSYERPLVPERGPTENHRVEKLVERLAFLRKDWGTGDDAVRRWRTILDELAGLDIRLSEVTPPASAPVAERLSTSSAP